MYDLRDRAEPTIAKSKAEVEKPRRLMPKRNSKNPR
jgi:hypothetical protein